ncbi:MAG: RNA 2',3'-cyclic phosphodiesterase [Candidatus Nitrohelix vancouverensis]|uniref:RNA 2',3'-cyclic phosphodiesterase n=1 Tax=Candidatus Nitrohelix vancouverensis TaxID=2705534 RepID=A0A7T0G4M0_9BACT|nr:MAG: RNA 2',3'-cyclic phosphodiesterase [Candidatus Nitrohelix vancouverensis]
MFGNNFSETNRIRLFLATQVPPKVILALSEAQDNFRKLKVKASWVRRENMHITLKFLGDIAPDTTSSLIHSMTSVGKRSSQFNIAPDKITLYPDESKPRILAVVFNDSEGQMAQLHQNIEDALVRQGIAKDSRSFTPHLTLGRFKLTKKDAALSQAVQTQKKLTCGSFGVDTFQLVHSQLTVNGPIYTPIEEFTLADDPSDLNES